MVRLSLNIIRLVDIGREYPIMPLELILGIDAGCNEVKVVGSKGALKFPTHTIKQSLGTSFKGALFGFSEPFELTLNGTTYLLGEHADAEDPDHILAIDELRAGTKNNDTAFTRGMAAICRYMEKKNILPADGDVNVYMTFGNPLESYKNDNDIKQIEKRFRNNKFPHEIVYNTIPYNIFIKDIYVMPEGIAAGYCKLFPSETIYVVDPGSQSINLTKLIKGVPSNPHSKTVPTGVENIKNHYKEKAANQLATIIRKEVMDLGWEEGSTLYICGGFASQILESFNGLINTNYKMELVVPEIPNIRLPQMADPIYANATGMYNIASRLFTVVAKG